VPPTENPHFITNDSGGAISFAGYFYRALDWSIATTNANLLRAISAPTCVYCQDYIRKIDALAASGGHSEGARLIASQFAPGEGTYVPADYAIKVTLTQDPQIIVQSDGARATYAPTVSPTINYLYVTWKDGDFIAVGIQLG
jgi:hypothetical protein